MTFGSAAGRAPEPERAEEPEQPEAGAIAESKPGGRTRNSGGTRDGGRRASGATGRVGIAGTARKRRSAPSRTWELRHSGPHPSRRSSSGRSQFLALERSPPETFAPRTPASAPTPVTVRTKAEPAVRRQRPVRARAVAAAVVGVAAAAVFGFIIAPASGGTGSSAKPLVHSAPVGPVTISFPAGWRRQSVPASWRRKLDNESFHWPPYRRRAECL